MANVMYSIATISSGRLCVCGRNPLTSFAVSSNSELVHLQAFLSAVGGDMLNDGASLVQFRGCFASGCKRVIWGWQTCSQAHQRNHGLKCHGWAFGLSNHQRIFHSSGRSTRLQAYRKRQADLHVLTLPEGLAPVETSKKVETNISGMT